MTLIQTGPRVVVSVIATGGGDWQVASTPTGFQGITSALFADNDYIHGFVRFENGVDWEEYDTNDSTSTNLLQIANVTGTVTITRPAVPFASSNGGARVVDTTGTHTMAISLGSGTMERILRETNGSWKTLTSGDATPDVAGYRLFKTAGTTTITAFDNMENGKVFFVQRGASDISIADGANISLPNDEQITLTTSNPTALFVEDSGVAILVAMFGREVLDEDDFSSNSSTKPPSQQSVAAYVAQVPNVSTATELTIASGSITPTLSVHTVDTEADAASDDLVTIVGSNFSAGGLIVISAANTARSVVLKATGGNIKLPNDIDRTIDDDEKSILLRFDGVNWNYVSGGDVVAPNLTPLSAEDSTGQTGSIRYSDGTASTNSFGVSGEGAYEKLASGAWRRLAPPVIFDTFISAEEQGVISDAVNDQFAAFKAMVEDVANTGKTIVLPTGTILLDVTASITPVAGLRLLGGGKTQTTIKIESFGVGVTYAFDITNDEVIFEALAVTAENATPSTNNVVFGLGADKLRWINCDLQSVIDSPTAPTAGTHLGKFRAACADIVFQDCDIHDCWRFLFSDNTETFTVDTVYLIGNQIYNIAVGGFEGNLPNGVGANLHIEENDIYDIAIVASGSRPASWGVGVGAASWKRVWIQRNRFFGKQKTCVNVEEDAEDWWVTENTMVITPPDGSTECAGIKCNDNSVGSQATPRRQHYKNNSITYTTDKQASTYGIYLANEGDGNSAADKSQVTGNICSKAAIGINCGDMDGDEHVFGNIAYDCTYGFQLSKPFMPFRDNLAKECTTGFKFQSNGFVGRLLAHDCTNFIERAGTNVSIFGWEWVKNGVTFTGSSANTTFDVIEAGGVWDGRLIAEIRENNTTEYDGAIFNLSATSAGGGAPGISSRIDIAGAGSSVIRADPNGLKVNTTPTPDMLQLEVNNSGADATSAAIMAVFEGVWRAM